MAGLRHPVLLLFCGILLLCGAGMMQWRSVMLRDLELSRRQGKHFEQMYRDSEEESKDWQQKYAKVKAQLERSTHKLRELETSKHTVTEQNLQAQRDIEDLKQKVLTEVEEASSMGKRAEAEQKGRQEAAERAEQCEKRLDAKMSEAQACTTDRKNMQQQVALLQTDGDGCRADLKQLKELVDHTQAELATARDERTNALKEVEHIKAKRQQRLAAMGKAAIANMIGAGKAADTNTM